MSRVAATEQVRKELAALLAGTAVAGESAHDFSGEFVRLAVRRLIQELLEAERTDFLGREPWQRKSEQRGYRNGYEAGRLKTAEGEIPIAVPQVRDADRPFRSRLRKRLGNRTETLQRLAVEAYARGLSTRDIEDGLADATGDAVLTRSAVSEVTESLWADFKEFQQRGLAEFKVVSLMLDGIWQNIRARGGKREAVLCAWGILLDGRKVLLHVTLGNKESVESWLAMIRDMVERELPPPLTVTVDGAPGLIAAVEQIWPKSLRIRCWVHKLRNIKAKLPEDVATDVLAEIYAVRDAGTHAQGRELAAALIGKYQDVYPGAMACLAQDLAASLNHLKLPARLRPLVRSTNGLERLFVEERRRSKVIPRFFGEKSYFKLAYAVLVRACARWTRVRFSASEIEQLTALRAAQGLAAWR